MHLTDSACVVRNKYLNCCTSLQMCLLAYKHLFSCTVSFNVFRHFLCCKQKILLYQLCSEDLYRGLFFYLELAI